MTERSLLSSLFGRWLPALVLAVLCLHQAPALAAAPPRGGDYIVAVVNDELVTNAEVEQRLAQIRDNAARAHQSLPPEAELRHHVVQSLIDERVMVTHARDAGMKVDDAELDRAVQSVAAQNQLTVDQLRERLHQQGMDFTSFRNNLRDQILVERVREREVQARIRVTDQEIDDYIAKQNTARRGETEYDIAQILVPVAEGASPEQVAQAKAVAQAAQQRVRSGEDFAAVAKQVSQDANREHGGEIGLRPVSRLPDVFVNVVKNLKPGQVAPELLRSGAGFHLLKLVDKRDVDGFMVTQTHARHILLRPSAQLPQDVAIARLAEFKQAIESGQVRFDELARKYSEDGSAAQGGDLGWTSPGGLVPEFEDAMNRLPVGGISDPVVSRFGVHLIQVIDRRDVQIEPKQVRQQAENALRERKFDQAYKDWLRDLRADAYIEMREPPQ